MRAPTSPNANSRSSHLRLVVHRSVRRAPARAQHLRGVARRALRAGNHAGAAALSVSFVGDRKMRSLNRVYAGNDYVTDVLSFPALEGAPRWKDPEETDFGDVIICVPQAQRQALAARHPLAIELDLLLTHGVLHLLGFDHDTPRRRAAMERAQRRALDTP